MSTWGGVETGGTWCVCAIGTGPEDLRAREQFRTGEPERTLDRIAGFFAAHEPVDAVGVGSFGPVDPDPRSPGWGRVTTTPKPGWRDVAVGTVLRERLGVPVGFDTDVAAAALGEHRWGAGRGLASLCYLTVGTGIGAGLLVDGRPVHGLAHPEVGHVRIPRDRERDPFAGACPTHGDCWEGLASGTALAERWGVAPGELPDDHEAWALEAEQLAAGILAIVMVASPERVIAGGGVLDRPGLRERVAEHLRGLVGGYLDVPLLGERVDEYLVAPELGDDAGVLGGFVLAERAAADAR